LGEACDDVNTTLDAPYRILGKKHRVLFPDPLSVMVLFGNDEKRLEVALLHLAVDRACENPMVEKLLELAFSRK